MAFYVLQMEIMTVALAMLGLLAGAFWPKHVSLIRRGLALTVLVSGGGAVYAVACFVTGAYRLSDLKALLGRRKRGPATGQEQV